jgi:DNA-binding XRE family transcriptional regulator
VNRGGQLPVSGTRFGGRPDPFGGTAPYRYRGIPGWDPAKLGPTPVAPVDREWRTTDSARAAQAAQAAERRAGYWRHRELGLCVKAAATAAGIAVGTARQYERERKREEGCGVSTRTNEEAGPLLGWPESRRVGPAVRLLREQAGMQVQELAPLVGLAASTLSELERACNRWRQADAEKAAGVLGTDLATLLGVGAQ